MTDVTSKMLNEKTGQVNKQADPSWDEILADVRAARAETGPTIPNPVLAERKARNYAARQR